MNFAYYLNIVLVILKYTDVFWCFFFFRDGGGGRGEGIT